MKNPWSEVTVDALEKLLLEMVGGDVVMFPGVPGVTFSEPIAFTSAKVAHAR